MGVKELQQQVDQKIKEYGGYWSPLSMLAHVSEELGEVSKIVNIEYGEKRRKSEHDGRVEDLGDEMADLLFTVISLANGLNIDLEKALEKKIAKQDARMKEVYGQ